MAKRAAHEAPTSMSATIGGGGKRLKLSEVDSGYEEQRCMRDMLQAVLWKRERIVVLAGAGISVAAGVPDFRSRSGLFRQKVGSRNVAGKDLFDAGVYRSDHATLDAFHQMVTSLRDLSRNTQPTSAHYMLQDLAEEGRLLRLYTQNVDGLETRLPKLATEVPLSKVKGQWPTAIQVHGSVHWSECIGCKELYDSGDIAYSGGRMPSCLRCSGEGSARKSKRGLRARSDGGVRPRMTLYQEQAYDGENIERVIMDDVAGRPDALIVVGTSLTLTGTIDMAERLAMAVRRQTGGMTVWINTEEVRPPRLKAGWDLIVHGDIQEVALRAGMGFGPFLGRSSQEQKSSS